MSQEVMHVRMAGYRRLIVVIVTVNRLWQPFEVGHPVDKQFHVLRTLR